jgi:hypothetical protein
VVAGLPQSLKLIGSFSPLLMAAAGGWAFARIYKPLVDVVAE